ncbi:hypothetical protein ACFFQW_23070 [Umezawaea endophytica]|uniref:Uncharacterized protein n=1 Tax=Umezawaea endophytica TaxID=1654476 RepID=A0A9X2VR87_9PSEU|nr:hypothetical protein [Umezawaea endophytica]MCS7481413.1 hypothetical protein [Umezawaea endophytica]
MTPLTFSHGDALIIVDGPVLEVFQRSVEGSNRIPLAWLGAWLDTERMRIAIGRRTITGGPVYTERPQSLIGFSRLPVQAEAVAHLRAFFAEVAVLAGRPA